MNKRIIQGFTFTFFFSCCFAMLPSLAQALPIFFGPTPYLSAADAPAGFYDGGSADFIENFEDGTLDGGITSPTLGLIVGATGFFADSVDSDDGVIDGSGNTGASAGVLSGGIIEFIFSGPLPTAAGLVWTDSIGGVVDFSAFGPGDVLLGSIGPFALADGITTGQTAEDRFFGIHDAAGISRIVISDTGGNFEVDHVQYGQIPATSNPIPIPGTLSLMLLAVLGLIWGPKRALK